MSNRSTGPDFLPTRRRMLSAIAAVAGVSVLGISAAGRRVPPVWRWRGRALGAEASLALCDPDRARARRSIATCLAEVERLERVFSLYRGDSEIFRLNRDGMLEAPSHDLVALLSEARRFTSLSRGSFDITVQPLWRLYASHFARPDAAPQGPSPFDVERTARLVDIAALDIRPRRIRFGRRGMGVTLNGIAQGAITDRISDMLRDLGYQSVLVELGEIRAASAPGDRPWRVGLDGGAGVESVSVTDGAVATSAGQGTRFDSVGRFHHLFEPATGECARGCRAASVFAGRATVTDTLSTAIAVAGLDRAPDLLAAFDADSARLVLNDGRVEWVRRRGTGAAAASDRIVHGAVSG